MRKEEILTEGWRFAKTQASNCWRRSFDDSAFRQVRVPHDYAIEGPFDEKNDLQYIGIEADGRADGLAHSGRTGGLPIGERAVYRKELFVPAEQQGNRVTLEFDGVMFNSTVYVNDRKAGGWYYGYTSFEVDITNCVKFGQTNLLAVVVEPHYGMSRWYTGAGIYRKVKLVYKNPAHIAFDGVWVRSEVKGSGAELVVETDLCNRDAEEGLWLDSIVLDPDGNEAVRTTAPVHILPNQTLEQKIKLHDAQLWDQQNPRLYRLVSRLHKQEKLLDETETVFGIRTLEFNQQGFYLNGKKTPIKGVCLHHDQGALGTAVNKDAIERQLDALMEMGCNSIRTSHNPPCRELLELCDQKGLLVMDEAFDEWRSWSKVTGGYAFNFDEEAEKDLTALVRRDRSHPCVFLWSIGNEVPDQDCAQGAATAKWLTDLCHRLDPTRLVTAGFNRVESAMKNHLADFVDIIGVNYWQDKYEHYRQLRPDALFIASETQSALSSRGVYGFPVPECFKAAEVTESGLLDSYDMLGPAWGCIPDQQFKALEDCPWMLGEYVWTGYDYLGEPTPFYEKWPSRSSYFGIFDLAGLPKDRYYAFKAHWSEQPVLHIFPHWTWPGREGKITPVHCYTSWPQAELFVNGVSQGVRKKVEGDTYRAYRLRWDEVCYEPGEITVKAMDETGTVRQCETIRTAGKPAALELLANKQSLAADGESLVFVTARIVDENGNFCPEADSVIRFAAENGCFLASDGGDQTSLLTFADPAKPAFKGALVGIFQSPEQDETGMLTIRAEGEGLSSAQIRIPLHAKQ